MRLIYDAHTGKWHTPEGQPCIHLQATGQIPAKPVRDFAPGEFIGWNCGYASEVERIEPRGAMADVYFKGKYPGPRRMKLDRLAAIASVE